MLDVIARTAARLCGATDIVVFQARNGRLFTAVSYGSMPKPTVTGAGAGMVPTRDWVSGRAFHELTRGEATLLISHRFSTVRMADRIVVLEHGAIFEDGTHDELIALGGRYADLYEKQASRYR